MLFEFAIFGGKIVKDITFAISGNRAFMVALPLNKCTYEELNLCSYPYGELSYLSLVQKSVGLEFAILNDFFK